MIRSTLIKQESRSISFNKSKQFFENGSDNYYAERQEFLINKSVTAKTCANTMATFLVGKGFGEHNTFKLGSNTLLTVAQKFARSEARQRGVFIHVKYNGNADIDTFDVLPYSQGRTGKEDGNKYNGKIGFSEDWLNISNNPIEWFDVYNDNKEVIKTQIETAKGIADYKGQILFINLDYDTRYPLSTIDATQNDCDSEGQASVYKNNSLRKGFFGKTMIITKPLIGDIDQETQPEEFRLAESERQNFKKTVRDFVGVENAEGVLHLELEFDDVEEIDKAFLVKTIETNIDDKLFSYTETSVKDNIRFAFNNIPSMLVNSTDGNMFGQSGDGIKQAKLFYQDQTEQERMVLFNTLQMLLSKTHGFKGTLKQELLVIETEQDDTTS